MGKKERRKDGRWGLEEGKNAGFPGPSVSKFSEWELGNSSQEKKVIHVVTVRSIICGAYGDTRSPFQSLSCMGMQ